MSRSSTSRDLPRFDRDFFGSKQTFSCIGTGGLGGKAEGLIFIERFLSRLDPREFPGIEILIPRLAVIGTDLFDVFLERNALRDAALSGAPDLRIAQTFQRADLPAEMVGDLRALAETVRSPLAIRSSSLLEDALDRPFAGVYSTKMTPNNQLDADTRFRRLAEAVRYVYASTYFSAAREYLRATDHPGGEEKMAVIIQEVVGARHGERFYPDLSGVARSWNFYPIGHAEPENGVVDLALGLGKTIVDGGRVWTYSPAWPRVSPPAASIDELLEQTQLSFWAVNMGKPPAFDPLAETEYLVRAGLAEADGDGTLRHLASTYDRASDRLAIGTGVAGPRLLNFAPLLHVEEWPLNRLIRRLLELSEEAVGEKVEIEFAMTLPTRPGSPARFGFLQVRPMAVSSQWVEVDPEEMSSPRALVMSVKAMGNGLDDSIRDIVYVKPRAFDPAHTREMGEEIEAINRELAAEHRPYLLAGFGRWGSSDPSLGIPVEWGQISGARAIVESTLEKMLVEPSQGSHFFHNMTSFRVCYFTVDPAGGRDVDWGWLDGRPAAHETRFVRHLRLEAPIRIKVDGRTRRGVVLRPESS